MNKVKIELNKDGTYNVTLPGGGQSLSLSPKQVAQHLQQEEQRFQKVLDDIKARREEFEKKTEN